MSTTSTLSFFPAPYPDECLYSVFCRYHIRNGSPARIKTIHDLFGKQASLTSSIVTPYSINYAERWYPDGCGITRQDLAYKNTAFQYYLISAWSYRAFILTKMINGEMDMGKNMHFIRKELCHGITHLQYCPACAQEDRQIYGETYWHRLHQLSGVRYCPVHEERILESEVTIQSTRWQFFPASSLLSKKPHRSPQHSKIDPFKRNYIKLASVVAWLLQNGKLLGCGDHFDSICARILKPHHYYTRLKEERYQGRLFEERFLSKNLPATMLNELTTDDTSPYYLPPIMKACVIMLLAESAQAFYKGNIAALS